MGPTSPLSGSAIHAGTANKSGQLKPIRKLLVANRSEIAIRVFRSAHELGIRTVAMYSHEDRFALHRFKADEAYRIGSTGEPLRSYLDIDAIIALARDHEVDAIHPGYGFLSENPKFAQACKDAGIIFVGPRVEVLEQLGDKLAARRLAKIAKVPILSGSDDPVNDKAAAQKLAASLGFPVIVKASMGGGGRGMRVANSADQLDEAIELLKPSRSRPARSALRTCSSKSSSRSLATSKCNCSAISTATSCTLSSKRDCSLQRRHQCRRTGALAPNLADDIRTGLDAALAVGNALRSSTTRPAPSSSLLRRRFRQVSTSSKSTARPGVCCTPSPNKSPGTT